MDQTGANGSAAPRASRHAGFLKNSLMPTPTPLMCFSGAVQAPRPLAQRMRFIVLKQDRCAGSLGGKDRACRVPRPAPRIAEFFQVGIRASRGRADLGKVPLQQQRRCDLGPRDGPELPNEAMDRAGEIRYRACAEIFLMSRGAGRT